MGPADTSEVLSEIELRQWTQTRSYASIVSQSDGAPDKLLHLLLRVIQTAQTPSLPSTHQAAAFNLLSTLLNVVSAHPDLSVRSPLWSLGIWRHAVDVYVRRTVSSRPKPARQLLSACISALRGFDEDDHAAIRAKSEAVAMLLCSAIDTSVTSSQKAALVGLTQFLTKKCIDLGALASSAGSDRDLTLLADDNAVLPQEGTSVRQFCRAMIRTLTPYALTEDLSAAATGLILAIVHSHEAYATTCVPTSVPYNESTDILVDEIVTSVQRNPMVLQSLRDTLLPAIFQRNFALFDSILAKSRHSSVQRHLSPNTARGLVACILTAGNSLGFVDISDQEDMSTDTGARCISISVAHVQALVQQNDPALRLSGLRLIVATSSLTRPFHPGSLRALRGVLPAVHADCDAHVRSEVYTLIQTLTDRLRASMAAMVRRRETGPIYAAHRAFTRWYIDFLLNELRPSASYQRHICALTCINILIKSAIDPQVTFVERRRQVTEASWPEVITLYPSLMIKLLLDLLMDPFDDVRSAAASILSDSLQRTALVESAQTHSVHLYIRTRLVAETLALRTAREDHADGLAHAYALTAGLTASTDAFVSAAATTDSLCNEIQETLSILETDRIRAVYERPLHAHITSLRYVLEGPFTGSLPSGAFTGAAWSKSVSTLLRLPSEIWESLGPVLCIDAPEGHVPDDMDDQDDQVDTKTIMSFAWRAVKEASLLIRTLLTPPAGSLVYQLVVDQPIVRDLCELTLRQLQELRHRGAFSTVANTFMTSCMWTNRYATDAQTTLSRWLESALHDVKYGKTINTRRSAGLPAIFIAIISAADKNDFALFKHTMLELQAVADNDAHDDTSEALPRVHALNCVKDIFRHPKLCERTEPYIPSAVTLAGRCLSSEIWGVRNSGLMLFRALLDRIFGNHDMNTVQATKLRLGQTSDSLIAIAVELLSQASHTENPSAVKAEGTFPALQLLRRLSSTVEYGSEVIQAVERVLRSSQWHIRDLAAQTLAVITPAAQKLQTFEGLLDTTTKDQNELHGALLCCRYISRDRVFRRSTRPSYLRLMLASYSTHLYHVNTCPVTKAAFVDLLTSAMGAEPVEELDEDSIDMAKELTGCLTSRAQDWVKEGLLRRSLIGSIHTWRIVDLNVIVQLAGKDPDACVYGLDTLCQHTGVSGGTLVDPPALARLCARLLHIDGLDVHVCDAARKLLLALMANNRQSVMEVGAINDLCIIQVDESPLTQDVALISSAALLGLRLSASSDMSDSSTSLQQWMSQLQLASTEDQPFDTRLAAVRAISQLGSGGFVALSKLQDDTLFVKLLSTLYDLTNDDDDIVRDEAATAAALGMEALSSAQSSDVQMPLLAGAKIVANLCRHHNRSGSLAAIAMSKLTGQRDLASSKVDMPPVSEHTSAALFAVEKQNLFVDPAHEARLWSRGLMRLHPAAVSAESLLQLAAWTTNALEALVQKARTDPGGPLSWARSSDTFTYGLQIVFAAEVILHFHRVRGIKSSLSQEIRSRLVELLVIDRKRDINPLWRIQIERVLLKAILPGVKKVACSLTSITSRQHSH